MRTYGLPFIAVLWFLGFLGSTVPVSALSIQEIQGRIYAAASRLVQFMTPEERDVAQSIRFEFPNDNTPVVLAKIDEVSGKRVIVISNSAYADFTWLANALAITTSEEMRETFLPSYMSYLGQRFSYTVYGQQFKSPNEFVRNLEPEHYHSVAHQADFLRTAVLQNGVLEFIIAHEAAHHILGHVATTGDPELERLEELQADKWALELLLRSGNTVPSPFFVTRYFHEREFRKLEQDISNLHPSGLERSITLLESYTSSLEKMSAPTPAMRQFYGNNYNFDVDYQNAIKFLKEAKIERDNLVAAQQDHEYWFELAEGGDIFAMARIADGYSHALNGFEFDWETSIDWHKRLLNSPHNFDLANIAQSNYALGYFYAFHKKYDVKFGSDKELARPHFEASAGLGLSAAMHALKRLDEN